jgi:transcriptional regulator with XRE-family HTH domain
MWHVWVKAYRRKHGLTQERAASLLCIPTRTLQRWEAGAEPTAAHVEKFGETLMPSEDYRLAANIRPLLEITNELMLALDQNGRVVGQSKSHMAHLHSIWRDGGDATGLEWMASKYAPERIKFELDNYGGLKKCFNNGFVSFRVPFIDERPGVGLVNAGRSDNSFLRMADGNVVISITHKITDHTTIEEYLRPAVNVWKVWETPDAVTTLD